MSEQNNDVPENKYVGNQIPIVIKIAWVVLITWAIYYIISFSLPDLKSWL